MNPTYGQGIAKASIGAIALDATLRHHSKGQKLNSDFAHQYFKTEGSRVGGFYEFTKREDYGYPGTEVEEGEDKQLGKFELVFSFVTTQSYADVLLAGGTWARFLAPSGCTVLLFCLQVISSKQLITMPNLAQFSGAVSMRPDLAQIYSHHSLCSRCSRRLCSVDQSSQLFFTPSVFLSPLQCYVFML